MELQLSASSSNLDALNEEDFGGFLSGSHLSDVLATVNRPLTESTNFLAGWETNFDQDQLLPSWQQEGSQPPELPEPEPEPEQEQEVQEQHISPEDFGITVDLTPEERATFHDMIFNSSPNTFVKPLSYIEIKKEGGSKYEDSIRLEDIELSAKLKEEPEKKRKRPRSKKTAEEEETRTTSSVALPREKILVLSSREMQEYIDEVKRTRNISSEEEKELKRQKRLIKNRESALASRTRKKAHIEDLRAQVDQVEKDRDLTNNALDALTKETEQLKQQALNMQNIIRKSPFLSDIWDRMMQTKPKQRLDINASSSRTSTTILIILLCMFGMFFESLRGPQCSTSSCEKTSSSLLLAPHLSMMDDLIAPSELHTTSSFSDLPALEQKDLSTAVSSSSSSSTFDGAESDLEEYCPETKPSNSSAPYLLCAPAQHVSLEDTHSYDEASLPHLITFFLPLQLVQHALMELASSLTISSTVSTTTSSSSSNATL